MKLNKKYIGMAVGAFALATGSLGAAHLVHETPEPLNQALQETAQTADGIHQAGQGVYKLLEDNYSDKPVEFAKDLGKGAICLSAPTFCGPK